MKNMGTAVNVPYFSSETYEGSTVSNQVFYQDGTEWKAQPKNGSGGVAYVSDLGCSPAKYALNSTGWRLGHLDIKDKNGKLVFTYSCTYTTKKSANLQYRLAVGNYLNYLKKYNPALLPKIDIAKSVLKEIIDSVRGSWSRKMGRKLRNLD
jgi:hypothetical protein